VEFAAPGSYTLQVTATDALGSQTLQVGPITVNPAVALSSSQGWILSPTNRATVTGLVPITLIPSETLTGGTLLYYPVSNPNAVTVLNPNTTGAGQIATLDTTTLNNGSYYILLEATDTTGKTQGSGVYITVAGDYKPGRVTATVTDLVVPAPGLPIQIQRTYDSLLKSQSGDFGYGWNLGIKTDLQTSPTNDVTLTINGQRRTFYFAPTTSGVFVNYYLPQYTAEPGLFGSLTSTGDNCSGVLLLVGNLYECAIANPGQAYQTTGYVYTDAYGRVYTIGPDGSLQSLKDLNGNTLTVTAAGITSSTGLSVPFVRDGQGRITQITDAIGNFYKYAYDATGNLSTVTLPSITQPTTYGYDPTHLLTSEKDPRGNTGSTSYYPNGTLQSITDAAGQTTSYVYNVATNTTTVTHPDSGTVTTVADAYGMPLSVTDPLGRITTNTYDANHNLLTTTDPLGKTTTYTYDSNGFRTSLKDPLNNVWSATYGQVGDPTSVSNPLGQTQTFSYDADFNISTITDSLGQAVALTYNPLGLPSTLRDANGNAWSYLYDQYGNRTRNTDQLSRITGRTYDNMGPNYQPDRPAWQCHTVWLRFAWTANGDDRCRW
jgi:YD repeat-containing protein